MSQPSVWSRCGGTTIESRVSAAALHVDGRRYSADGTWTVSNPHYLDHGTNPANARYAYAVVPSPTVVSLAKTRLTRVLSNTPVVQAMRTLDGVELGVFFAAGQAGSVTTSASAAVGWGGRTLTVADPRARPIGCHWDDSVLTAWSAFLHPSLLRMERGK